MVSLKLVDIDGLRDKSAPLSSQIAGYTSSDKFKSPNARSKQPSKPMNHHFSTEAVLFAGSELKKTANNPVAHSFIPLGTGRPRADIYPWQAVTLHVDNPLYQPPALNGVRNHGSVAGNSTTIPRHQPGYDLAHGLNYSHAAGSQPLVRFFTEHVELVHDPPYRDWGICLSAGSTSAMEMAMRIFCNRGDTILTERYTYPGTIEGAQLLGLKCLGIDMDAEGLDPSHLQHVLSGWEPASQGPKPRLFYTIPSGQNPTGVTQPLERKKAIYQVAEAHDLIIIEDDPYYFLQLSPSPKLAHRKSAHNPERQPSSTHEAATSFLATLPASLLHLDTTGRVVRLDSASKILAPGLRAGWVTASAAIIEKFVAYTEVSTVAVGGPTQLVLWHLLEATWGHAGFLAWLTELADVYSGRQAALVRACRRYLPLGICSWVVPRCGMFLWIRVELRGEAYNGTESGVAAQEDRIVEQALRRGVQVTKGSLFDTRPETESALYLRLTYAAAEVSEFGEGVRKLGEVLKDEFGNVTIA